MTQHVLRRLCFSKLDHGFVLKIILVSKDILRFAFKVLKLTKKKLEFVETVYGDLGGTECSDFEKTDCVWSRC